MGRYIEMQNVLETKKRVICLYRVSTTQQVYKSQDNDRSKDDIPMQRIVCRDFAEKMGWIIVDEKLEKGVSGYKTSASKRDAIQDLKEMALKKEFDILLVFMFDRLGRHSTFVYRMIFSKSSWCAIPIYIRLHSHPLLRDLLFR